jgi:succinoglycan biosynthesis transport protein ExoP
VPQATSSFAPQPRFLPRSIVRMLWKQRWVALSIWLVVSLTAYLVVHGLADVYQAEAVILVDSQKIPEKFVASTVQVSVQDSLNSISQQVLTVTRLEQILDKYNLYPGDKKNKTQEELVERLRHDLDITLERGFSLGRPGAFRVAYQAPSPSVAAGVVNEVADLFVTQNVKTREQRAEGTSEFIENQLSQAKKSLDQQEAQLSTYKLKWAGELPQQETALMGALSRLQQELQGNQDATSRAEQNKLVLENSLRFAESSVATLTRAASQQASAPALTTGPVTPAPVPASVRLKTQLDELSQRYYDDHPEVRRVKRELAQAQAEEASNPPATASADVQPAVATAKSSETSQFQVELDRQRERASATRTQLVVLDQEIKGRAAERQRILQDMAEYQARVEKLPIREQQMAALTRDYETSKGNYRSLLDKKISAEMATEMEKSQQSERFTVLEPARPPETPIKPRRQVMYLAGALGGLALGLALGLARELKKDVFLGEWELPKTILVLGRVSNAAPPTAITWGQG